MISLSDAIISLGWTKGTSVKDGVINWYGEEGIPLATLQAEVSRLQAIYDSQEYSRLRELEYAKLNQDELRFDDLINNTTVWRDTILDIKVRFPK